MAKLAGSSRASSRQRQASAQPVERVTRARSQTPQNTQPAASSSTPNQRGRPAKRQRNDLPVVEEDGDAAMEDYSAPPIVKQEKPVGIVAREAMKALQQEVQRRRYASEADEKRKSLPVASSAPMSGLSSLKERMMRLRQEAATVSGSATHLPNQTPAMAPNTEEGNPTAAAPIETPDLSSAIPEVATHAVGSRPAVTKPAVPQCTAPNDDGPIIPAVDDDDQPSPSKPSFEAEGTLRAFAALQQQQTRHAAKAKVKAKASFVDRQANAQRISFNDDAIYEDPPATNQVSAPRASSSVVPPASAAPQSTSASTTAKRQHALVEDNEDDEDDFDPTQDNGFQTDTRDLTRANIRREALPKQNPRRFAQFAPTPMVSIASNRSGGPALPPTQRRNPGSSIPAMPPAPDPNDDTVTAVDTFEVATVLARQNTVAAKIQNPARAARPRKPWTKDQILALTEYIAKLGPAYSTIKHDDDHNPEGSRLAGRTQDDLRFKARNMKYIYLKSKVPLPQNFEEVPINQAQIDKLHEMGIPYHQERQRDIS